MGKSRNGRSGKRRVERANGDLSNGAHVLGKSSQASKRQAETIALVKRLNSTNEEERLQACIAVGLLFRDGVPEEPSSQSASDGLSSAVNRNEGDALKTMEMDDVNSAAKEHADTEKRFEMNFQPRPCENLDRLVALLRGSDGFKSLLNRLMDSNPQIRYHACGALCSIAHSKPQTHKDMVSAGILEGVVYLFSVCKSAHEDAVEAETLALALNLLCFLCETSTKALGLIEDREILDKIIGFILVNKKVNASEEVNRHLTSVSENASRLLHTALDGNRRLAVQAADAKIDNKLLEFCRNGQGNNITVTNLHCVGSLVSVAMVLSSQIVDPSSINPLLSAIEDVCSRVLDTSNNSEVSLSSEQLCYEVLVNACSFSDVYEGLDMMVDDEDAKELALVSYVADFLALSATFQHATTRFLEISHHPSSHLATAIGPRCCAFLDNMVQNVSEARLSALNAGRLWNVSLEIVKSIVFGDENSEMNELNPMTEELLCSASALCWSIIRRLQSTTKSDLAAGVTIQSANLEILVGAIQKTESTDARRNLAGVVGSLCCIGSIGLECGREDLVKLISVLKCLCEDLALPVAMQAVDSLIDIFSVEERDQVFNESKVQSVLEASMPRMRSCLIGAKSSSTAGAPDRASLSDLVDNLTAFLKYKKFQSGHCG